VNECGIGNDKGFPDIIAGAFLPYALFVAIVGSLFTLMLFFGKPVEQG